MKPDLPAKFTQAERNAYKWLFDCQIDGWAVDMGDRSVLSVDSGKHKSLVAFARSVGMKGENDGK